jgi:cation transport regulator ChaB
MIKAISGGLAHDLPPDLRKVLTSDPKEILHRSLAMSGFAGLFPSKNRRRDENTSNEYAHSLKK